MKNIFQLPNMAMSLTLRLVLMLVIEVLVIYTAIVVYRQHQTAMFDKFSESANDSQLLIRQSFYQQEEILRGLRGLFHASNQVDPDEYADYLAALELFQYAGVESIGFATYVLPDNKESFPQQIKQEANFSLVTKPLGQNTAVFAVTYLWAKSEKSRGLIGFDLLSNAEFKNAVIKSVLENTLIMTPKLTQQEMATGSSTVVLVLPVFKRNSSITTESERWQSLLGVVYGVYAVDEMMIKALGHHSNSIDIHLFSGDKIDNSNILLDTRPDEIAESKSSFNLDTKLTLYSQAWTLQQFSKNEFEKAETYVVVWLLLGAGTLINLFIGIILWLLAKKQKMTERLADRAVQDAEIINNQLQFNEERFRLSLDSSNMGIWSWYLDSNLIQWDYSVRQVFGIGEEQPLNTYEEFLSLIHQDDRQPIFEKVAYAIENKSPLDAEYRIVNTQGEIRHIATRAKVIFNNPSKTYVMAGTCWDITERRRHEKMKEEFVSVVSHELRTPLTAVAGVISLLQSGALGNLTEKAHAMLEMANKNATRLKLLINDLLDIEKLLSGKMQMNLRQEFILFLMEKIVEENRPLVIEHNMELVLAHNLSRLDQQLLIDPLRFSQVITNFISNAVKFSPPESKIEIQVQDIGDMIRVAVRDSGIGISLEAQQHLFEKFYQVDSSSSRKKGGTGLGLAISKELVERMSGVIGFTSEVGEGSCFYVEFSKLA